MQHIRAYIRSFWKFLLHQTLYRLQWMVKEKDAKQTVVAKGL